MESETGELANVDLLDQLHLIQLLFRYAGILRDGIRTLKKERTNKSGMQLSPRCASAESHPF